MSNSIALRSQTEIQPRFNFEEMTSIAKVVSESGLFGRLTQPQVLTLMMLCEAEGIHPVKALQLYDIIDGKPTPKAVALLARFMESGGSVEWHEQGKTAAEATFTHPKTCPTGVRVRYTIEDAQCAGLAHKDNWKKNPADMLVARVCSRGVKRANPACILGMDIPEADEQPSPIETTARSALVDTLSKRRERPEVGTRVADTVAELKAAETPPVETPKPAAEPQTEWGKVIAEATLDANKALADMAEQNPENLELRKPLKVPQVVNGVVKAYVEAGTLTDDALRTDGKRDARKVAAAIQALWDEDREEVEAAIARYLGGKLTEAMGPAKTERPEPALS